MLKATSQQLFILNHQHISAALWNLSQTLQHNSPMRPTTVRWCQERNMKRNFFSFLCSAKSLLSIFKFNVVGYRARFDFNRVLRARMWRWDGLPTFSFSFVCLWLYTFFGWNLNFVFFGFFSSRFMRKEGRSVETLFCSFPFSRIIAYEHSNDETFIEL